MPCREVCAGCAALHEHSKDLQVLQHLVASLAACSGVWQVRQPERLLCAAAGGLQSQGWFLPRVFPCLLRMLSIGIARNLLPLLILFRRAKFISSV